MCKLYRYFLIIFSLLSVTPTFASVSGSNQSMQSVGPSEPIEMNTTYTFPKDISLIESNEYIHNINYVSATDGVIKIGYWLGVPASFSVVQDQSGNLVPVCTFTIITSKDQTGTQYTTTSKAVNTPFNKGKVKCIVANASTNSPIFEITEI